MDVTAVRFIVPGPAVGKGRAKAAKRGAFIKLYTPEKTVNYESRVALCAQQAMAGRPLFEGPLSVEMEIVCQVPASWSKRKQADALRGAVQPTTKPDIDNVEKAIFDALNGVAWGDDVQVVRVSKSKQYGPVPGVSVAIAEAVPVVKQLEIAA